MLRLRPRIIFFTACGLAASLLLGLVIWLGQLGIFSNQDERLRQLIEHTSPDATLVFDRDGQKIGEYFTQHYVFVPIARIPKFLIDAVLATEDRSFREHHGVDFSALMRAAAAIVRDQRYTQGGSTLTMQLVRNFLLTRERSIERKVKEIALSLQVERALDKDRILELYLNNMFLGHGSYGVEAAAQRYFGRSLQELRPHELATIAGLFQLPSAYDPHRHPQRAKNRQLRVLTAMVEAGMISPADREVYAEQPLQLTPYRPVNGSLAPHFIAYIRQHAEELLRQRALTLQEKAGESSSPIPVEAAGTGLRIFTTLDAALQKEANRAIAEAGARLDKSVAASAARNKEDVHVEAALVAVDPSSGEVRAMVGGRNFQRSQFNRAVDSRRSPGSAFKPIVYSVALDKKRSWSDLVYVGPFRSGTYTPRNARRDDMTEATLLKAFYRSMNTPAVELAQAMGVTDVVQRAKAMGVTTPLKRELGVALGGSEVTMLDMARLYSVFAAGGRRAPTVAISRIEDQNGRPLYEAPRTEQRLTQVLSESTAFLMTMGMQAVLTHGTGHAASHLSRFAAGKTGTSDNSVDNWFCGYTPQLTTIVWVGSDEHVPLNAAATGGTLALPIWSQFMTAATHISEPPAFAVPEGVTMAIIHPDYGHATKQGVAAWFPAGHGPREQDEPVGEALESLGSTGNFRSLFSH